MSIQLQEAINRAETFADLVPIAKQLTARLSFWGREYVIINPNIETGRLNYEGPAPLDAVINRIYQMMRDSGRNRSSLRLYSNEEHSACQLLENEINRFYNEDAELFKKSWLITKIAVFVRNIFRMHDLQSRWDDDLRCGRQVIRRPNPRVWDDATNSYIDPPGAVRDPTRLFY